MPVHLVEPPAIVTVSTCASLCHDAPVGLLQRPWVDPSRQAWSGAAPRPLRVTLWYPAVADARMEVLPAGPFALEPVAPGAAPAASPARLPLLLLSHGTGGSALAMSWLARALAARGFLVAGVDHHGNTGAEAEYRLEAFLAWWDRPRDLSAALDRLLADPQWGPRVDTQRVGVIGFSLGGYTALAALGARLDAAALAHFHSRCADEGQCLLPPEIAARHSAAEVGALLRSDGRLRASIEEAGRDWSDARFRAGLVLAPVMGALMSAESLTAIRVPLHLIASEADDQAPPSVTAQRVAAAVPGATVHVLQGAGHYSFLSPCNEFGRQQAAPICSDPPDQPRERLHRQLQAEALDFFARALPPR
ncbi:MAG: alpha/beta hydrolase [Burkholderiaceae bacterium]|nr:alpha/beta hydrolase [Burkholderiaceae bacterium]